MDKNKKIIQISTYDKRGGAAIAALRLSNALRQLGYDSSLLVKDASDSNERVRVFHPRATLPYRVGRFVRRFRMRTEFEPYKARRPASMELFSDDRSEFGAALPRQISDCHIVNLHWVNGLVDVKSFFGAWHKPVVWTLHDMNPFTGGCHYSGDCDRYVDRCGRCPQLFSDREKDLSRSIWNRKNRSYENLITGNLHIVTPSQWMANLAEKSSLLKRFPKTVIPNGIDTEVFSPRDTTELRASLGIPEATPVVLFVADYAANERKGFLLLAEALRILDQNQEFCLISIGGDQPELPEGKLHVHLGRVSDENRLATVYSLADVFVIPSVQDNLPNTTLESLACGTPVAGFRTGGVPEVVREGITGRLADPGDLAGLRNAILDLLNRDDKAAEMSKACRNVALSEYAQELQAARYLELYQKVFNRTGGAPGSQDIGKPS